MKKLGEILGGRDFRNGMDWIERFATCITDTLKVELPN